MAPKNILFVSKDLILVNHLILILTNIGYYDYTIIQNIEEGRELLRFSKFDLIIFHNQDLKFLLGPKFYSFAKGAKLIVLGKMDDEMLGIIKLDKERKIHNLRIPFVSFEIKKIFSETLCA